LIGQTTTHPNNYQCDENNFQMKFTLSNSSHSARNLSANCSLPLYISTLSNSNNTCQSTMTPCFEYRGINNQTYYAPAALCSIVETCQNPTNQCSSNTSICVVNSCCSTGSICLPLAWRNICQFNSIITSTPSI